MKNINKVKSFFEEGMYNPTWISKRLKISWEFTKGVLDCLHIGVEPEDQVISQNWSTSDINEQLIKSYFNKYGNIGKSIKALHSFINKDRIIKIPMPIIKKVLRKTGIRFVNTKIWKKSYKVDYTINKLWRHSLKLLKLLDQKTIIVFVDTVKFWSQDYNKKIWVKTNSALHEKAKERNNKSFLFDMIVASELNLGAIGAQAFENHHNAQDWGYFINKLIEQCDQLFSEKKVIIFLDNSPLHRPSVIEKWIGPRITFFYN